jgi:phage shock protein PspC (stress-responsive transcriptional regulator)
MKKLYRSRNHAVIGGVCAGIARYFEWNVRNVRWATALLGLCVGGGVLAYIVLWIVLPVQD